jgi:hypothetical protein
MILLAVLSASLLVWMLGEPQPVPAAQKAVQITVPDCRA